MKNILISVYLIWTLVIFQSCTNHTKQNATSVSPQYLQKEIDTLDARLTTISEESVIPGFVATVLKGNKKIYSKAFGYSDLANKHKFSPQTVHTLASVSKTVVGLAIMKLVENGKIKSDEPLND